MLLREVAYCRPVNVEDALAVLREHPGARPLAGGQTLINVLKLRAASVDALVDISELEELRFIRRSSDGGLEIGACVTYDELEHSEEVGEAVPILAEVATHTVDQQVRNRGTIGGNCCFNDPASNFPPLLVALGATMGVASGDGGREIPAEEFFIGHFHTAVDRGELLRSVSIPPLDRHTGVGYSSLLLGPDSWAIARAAAWVRADASVEEARVVLGCVAPRPLRLRALEERLRGAPANAPVEPPSAAELEGVDPVGDMHGSPEYRRELAAVMAVRAVQEAIDRRAGP